jgi:hypothetical protein
MVITSANQYIEKPYDCQIACIPYSSCGKLTRMAQRIKRGYTRAFKARGTTGRRYLLDNVPAGLWTRAQTQAKREGLSMRGLILTLLQQWMDKGGGVDGGI